MRAILIDPIEQKVSEVDYDGNIENIYTFLTTDGFKPRFFDVVAIPFGSDGIYIDDEGLYAPIQSRWSFDWHTWREPIRLVNRGLVIGCDDEGNSCESTSGVDIINQIKWSW